MPIFRVWSCLLVIMRRSCFYIRPMDAILQLVGATIIVGMPLLCGMCLLSCGTIPDKGVSTSARPAQTDLDPSHFDLHAGLDERPFLIDKSFILGSAESLEQLLVAKAHVRVRFDAEAATKIEVLRGQKIYFSAGLTTARELLQRIAKIGFLTLTMSTDAVLASGATAPETGYLSPNCDVCGFEFIYRAELYLLKCGNPILNELQSRVCRALLMKGFHRHKLFTEDIRTVRSLSLSLKFTDQEDLKIHFWIQTIIEEVSKNDDSAKEYRNKATAIVLSDARRSAEIDSAFGKRLTQ
jgi:hypothetical protein